MYTTIFYFILFFKETNTFIQQRHKLIKGDSKYIYIVTKIKHYKKSISNKCCSFELSIHQRILKNNGFNKNMRRFRILFLKDHVTMKTEVITAETSALSSQE